MRGSDHSLAPGDRDNTLLVVLIALLSLPAIGLLWVWLARSGYDPGRGFSGTLAQVDDDPLLLLVVADFCLAVATACVLLWRDAAGRGVGRSARLGWLLALVLLGTLGAWIYLAVRPRRPGTELPAPRRGAHPPGDAADLRG